MPPAGFEPTASGLGILRSILLSYRGVGGFSGCYELFFNPVISSCGLNVDKLAAKRVFYGRKCHRIELPQRATRSQGPAVVMQLLT